MPVSKAASSIGTDHSRRGRMSLDRPLTGRCYASFHGCIEHWSARCSAALGSALTGRPLGGKTKLPRLRIAASLLRKRRLGAYPIFQFCQPPENQFLGLHRAS